MFHLTLLSLCFAFLCFTSQANKQTNKQTNVEQTNVEQTNTSHKYILFLLFFALHPSTRLHFASLSPLRQHCRVSRAFHPYPQRDSLLPYVASSAANPQIRCLDSPCKQNPTRSAQSPGFCYMAPSPRFLHAVQMKRPLTDAANEQFGSVAKPPADAEPLIAALLDFL